MKTPVFFRLRPRPLRWVAGLLLLIALRPAAAQSLVFDGKSDRLLLPGSERRLPAEGFTLEAWVRSPHWKNAWFENTLLSTDDVQCHFVKTATVDRLTLQDNRPKFEVHITLFASGRHTP